METMKATIFTVLFLSSAFAFAGASNAELNCRSSDGLTVKGHVPGDFAEFDLSIEQNGKSARLYSVLNQSTSEMEENATIAIVQDLRNKVWTLSSSKIAQNSGGTVRMYALPQTVRNQNVRQGYEARFQAKLFIFLAEFGPSFVEKTVSCSLSKTI